MLLELFVTNIALIDSLRLSLRPGLTALTGETGAGKSILVDGVSLALGGRADKTLVRTGADRASVEAVFDISDNEKAKAAIAELNIDCEDGVLPITRELTASGRSLCRCGGQLVTLAQLKAVAATLVDMHGQHEHQFLLDELRHAAYLDAHGGDELKSALAAVSEAYAAYAAARAELTKKFASPEERARRIDMLKFQAAEIDEVKPKKGEDDALAKRRNLLRNAGRIAEGVARATELLSQGTRGSPSATDALHMAAQALEPLADMGENYALAHQRALDAYYAAQDAAETANDLSGEADFDPGELDAIETRLDALERLKKKYGSSIADVLAFREATYRELDELADGETRMLRLSKERDARWKELQTACENLSKARTVCAVDFSDALQQQLRTLGMEKARFRVEVTPAAGDNAAKQRAVTERGWDEVRFLFSPNPGEPEKPLARIASGGEMSRVMLALKAVGARQNDVPTLIFDEIDTGISGRMAQVVGESMAKLSQTRQVLCVTHLPQIAALGDDHLLIEKSVEGDRTRTTVTPLTDEGRVLALARMIGGAEEASESASGHARALLAAARPLRATSQL